MIEIFLATLLIPLVSALVLLGINKNNIAMLKYFAFGSSLVTLVLSVILFINFDSANPNMHFYFEQNWIPQIGAGFRIGVDGMSMMLLMLTAFLTPITI